MPVKSNDAPPIQLETPAFRTEAEEAEWWFTNRKLVSAELHKAAANGTLTQGTVARRYATPTTTIRLPAEDIALARQQAAARGLKYQTYLKSLIHQALRREARKRA